MSSRHHLHSGPTCMIQGRPHFRTLEGLPNREYFLYVPTAISVDARVLVLVHGISRNAIEQMMQFADLASRSNVVLVAPLFSHEAYRGYQLVIDRRRRTRADTALIDILDDVTASTGIDTQRAALFGFSGGAQFAHRFAFLYPQRVSECLCFAAGWYTYPDEAAAFPLGFSDHPMPGGQFDLEGIRKIPFHVMVGAEDLERDASVRSEPALDAVQGETRVVRAERWHEAMRRWGAHSRSSFEALPGLGHSFREVALEGALAERVFSKLGWMPA
jgi:pimeloyl-ACP methyl ester carboxylesterase